MSISDQSVAPRNNFTARFAIIIIQIQSEPHLGKPTVSTTQSGYMWWPVHCSVARSIASSVAASTAHYGTLGTGTIRQATSASKSSIRRFVITEKAPTRAFSWLKADTTAFTLHYAIQPCHPL